MALQGVAANATTDATTQPSTHVATEPSESPWSFSASAYTYIVPHAHEYVQPTFTADRDWLHLEARYNYEDQKTASTWIGCNFAGGEKLAWEFTPMIGGVFGDTTGAAPGYKGSITWRSFELYTEGEYVIDVGNVSNSFFYTWSELTFAPIEWLRFGIAAQRTHAYKSDRDIQHGVMLGITYKKLDFTAYVFNPDESRPIVVLGIRAAF